MYEAAKTLKEAGVSDKPFSFRASRWYFETWLTGIGGEIVNNDDGRSGLATEATFATPEADDLMASLQQMNDEGLLNVFAATEGGIDQFLALVTQDSSMLDRDVDGVDHHPRRLVGLGSPPSRPGVDFDVVERRPRACWCPAPAPSRASSRPGRVFPSGGAFYMLNTSEPEQQAASWRFLEFMLDPANAKTWLFSGGYLPVVKAVNDDPEVQAFWTDDLAGVLLFPADRAARRRRSRPARPAHRPVPRRGRRARGGHGGDPPRGRRHPLHALPTPRTRSPSRSNATRADPPATRIAW